MGDNIIRKKVDFPLYLEVLKQLPEVSDEEIADTEKVFEEAYGELPDKITFDIGGKKGDGEIFAFQRITDEAGRSYRTKLYITEDGAMSNPDTGFEGYISWNVAKYFVSSLFGFGELADPKFVQHKWIKKKGVNPFNEKGFDCFDKFDPFPEEGECKHYLHSFHGGITFIEKQTGSLMTPQLAKLAKGAGLLYEAAAKKGSLGAIASSDGAELIGEAEYQLITQLDLMTQEIWKDAEAMLHKAENGPEFWGPEEIEATIDKNADMKPEGPPLTYEQAMERYEAAVKMMRDIAATKAGEHYFKENHCTTTVEDEKFTVYECEYGVHGGKGFFVKETNPFE